MNETLWCFEAIDTLFFRDGKPFNAGESAWIDSQFPPTGYTLQGAIRTAVLTHLGADMAKFANGEPCLPDGVGSLKEALGSSTSLGKISLTGPFLNLNGEFLFPAPLDLIKTDDGFHLLEPDDKMTLSEIGRLRLPRLKQGKGEKNKAQGGKYVTANGMEILLSGKTEGIILADQNSNNDSCTSSNLWPLFPDAPQLPALVDREPKVGLARDNATRTAETGMLYAIAPVRPRKDVTLVVVVDGLSDSGWYPKRSFCQRLGGEGKLAKVEVKETLPLWRPALPLLNEKLGKVCFKLVLTTPALLPCVGWQPEGFCPVEIDGTTVWRGVLKGVTFNIISACIGKQVKIGGWDIANNKPHPLMAYVPAGSVYFCEADATDKEQVEGLHGKKIGERTEYGFGHVLIGKWNS